MINLLSQMHPCVTQYRYAEYAEIERAYTRNVCAYVRAHYKSVPIFYNPIKRAVLYVWPEPPRRAG